jgi:hypothetical protein
MTAQPIDTWLNDAIRAAVRRWAEVAVATNRAPSTQPNALALFCMKHAIVLDPFEPARTGRAILRVLALLDSMREDAP